jgi:hypothetical protein
MNSQTQLFATNKEIHDLLFSGRQRMTETVLHELLRDRGIFLSLQDSRDALVRYLSLLPHDFADVRGLLNKREASKRGEKTTAITTPVKFTASELKSVVASYQGNETLQKVSAHFANNEEYVVQVGYSEFDYSKTKLLQRQDREAEIVFKTTVDGCTEIKMPANDQARAIVDKLLDSLESEKKQQIPREEISLSSLHDDAAQRTQFFMKLITSISGFTLTGVSRLKVSRLSEVQDENEDIDLEDENFAEAILGEVRKVAIAGLNLFESEIFQELRSEGFFITSITWRAKQVAHPYKIIECAAEFEDEQAGKNFRYSVHGALKQANGKYTKTLRQIDDIEKSSLLSLIDKTARLVLLELMTAIDQSNHETI